MTRKTSRLIILTSEQAEEFDRMWTTHETYAAICRKMAEMGLHMNERSVGAIRKRRNLNPRNPGCAESVVERNKKPQGPTHPQTFRRCMMHGGEFLSRHPGERVCQSCRGSDAWRLGMTIYGG